MKYTFKISVISLIVASVLFSTSCIQGRYEVPEVSEIPTGDVITITRLWEIYDSLIAAGGGTYKFENDCSVYGYITMSDKFGNIYKSAYLQGGADDNKAINLHLLSSGGIYEGDYVRVYLKGLVLGDYSGMIQLDSVHVDNNIVKVRTRDFLVPENVGFENIGTGNYVGKLVKINDVQFQEAYIGTTYADKANKTTVNTYIEDRIGTTMIVRTSGYANFADDTIPRGSGSLVAVVGKYNDEYQLYIRNTAEVEMNNRRFGEVDLIFGSDFNDMQVGEFSVEGWQNVAEIGSAKWTCQQIGSGGEQNIALCISGNNYEDNESWLITPDFELPPNSFVSFSSRMLSGTNTLSLLISTDNGATWTNVNANVATSTSWAISGDISLAQYSGSVRMAFKFESPMGVAGKFFVDDFKVFR
ncbi:MAG: hypothetical protein HUK15_06985 [Bacteroidales bacterium]|nr:hypothetical protein [Bacteroidales bacterium]